MINIFNLELNYDDPLALALEIIAILHDVESTRVKMEIPIIIFVKAIYPTYSHYLESLQDSS